MFNLKKKNPKNIIFFNFNFFFTKIKFSNVIKCVSNDRCVNKIKLIHIEM